MSLVDKAVRRGEDGTWDITCPVTDGSCGTKATDDAPAQPFSSTGWPTKEVARARLDEHLDDHRGIAPLSDLDTFRQKHGLQATPDAKHAVVRIEDLS